MACLSPVSQSEFNALQSFYYSLDGPNWLWRNNTDFLGIPWDFTEAPADEMLLRPCKDHWQGVNCDKTTGEDNCFVFSLSLPEYGLAGTLPPDLTDLNEMFTLKLQHNSISGPIPTTLGVLTNMLELDLSYNKLTGSIPIIPTLVGELYLEYNSLSGNIPIQFMNLTYCKKLYLYSNHLTGPLPEEPMIYMINMNEFYVYNNYLTGPIPPAIGNMTSTYEFFVYQNFLTGSIPTELGLLATSLAGLMLFSNLMTGSIPLEFCQMGRMEELSIDSNFFTGTIPTQIGLMTYLEQFFLYDNSFSGTIPTEIAVLTKMEYLIMYSNKFTGTIPVELGNDLRLRYFYVDGNSLTGTIPTQLGNIPLATKVYFYENFFTGTIPSEFGEMDALMDFYANTNYLTGAIPPEVASLKTMVYLGLYENFLSSTLPAQFASSLNVMIEFDLHDNYLTGSLSQVFSQAASKFSSMVLLDLSDNGFTGLFPSDIFDMPNLVSLSATSNCFHGALTCTPAATSNRSLSGMQIVDMNGLSSGTNCRNYVSNLIPNTGYYPNTYMIGSIPSCIWQFSNLKTLYMIGNGFSGSIIPHSVSSISSALTNISLSYNHLSGEIPTLLQSHTGLRQLDLSYNRLSGTLSGSFAVNVNAGSALGVAYNRLSGPLPGSSNWSIVEGVAENILYGNLFTFSPTNIGIPESSASTTLSFNGSALLDISLLISLPLFILLMIFLSFTTVYYFDKPRFEKSVAWLFPLANSWYRSLQYIDFSPSFQLTSDHTYRLLFPIALGLTICSILMFSFVYLLLKLAPTLSSLYSTHSYQYGWLVSVAYFHGDSPAVLLSFLVTVFTLLYLLLWRVSDPASNNGSNNNNDVNRPKESIISDLSEVSNREDNISIEEAPKTTVRWITESLMTGSLFLLNVGFMLAVNSLYLVQVLNNNPNLLIIQIALAATKLAWNAMFITLVGSVRKVGSKSALKRSLQNMLFKFAVQYCNFILIPCLASSIVEGSCFLQLFQQQQAPSLASEHCPQGELMTTKEGIFCSVNISIYTDQSTDFEPPFMYSFQCGSAIITNYVPVLLYTFVISGFLFPAMWLSYFLYTHYYPNTESELPWYAVYVPKVVYVRPDAGDMLATRMKSVDEFGNHKTTLILPSSGLMSKTLLNFTIILTFGYAYPYLAAIALSSTLCEIGVWVLAVGRYRLLLLQRLLNVSAQTTANNNSNSNSNSVDIESSASGEHNEKSKEVNRIVGESVEKCFYGMREAANMNIPFIVMVTYFFWGVMSFDIVADIHGTNDGLVAMFMVMIAGPMILYGVYYLIERALYPPPVTLRSSTASTLSEQLVSPPIGINKTTSGINYSRSSNSSLVSNPHKEITDDHYNPMRDSIRESMEIERPSLT